MSNQVVASPLEVLVKFLPSMWRKVRRGGIEMWTLHYWHEDLHPYVGADEKVLVLYDPRDITKVYVRAPDGVIRECPAIAKDTRPLSVFEWGRMRRHAVVMGVDPAEVAARDAGIDLKDGVVRRSKAATAAAHRMTAREAERRRGVEKAYPQQETVEQRLPQVATDGAPKEFPVSLLDS